MKSWIAIAGLLLGSLYASAVSTDDLLPPEQAFKPSVMKKDDHTVVVHFDIAEGYYLYRDRMQFSLQPGDGQLTPTFPEGKVKHDDYFGDVVTYRHGVDVPLTAASLTADGKVKIVSQGCADAGVCYPPKTVTLALNDSGSGVTGRLASLFNGDGQAAPATHAAAASTVPNVKPASVVNTDVAKPAPAKAPEAKAVAPAPTVPAAAAPKAEPAQASQPITPPAAVAPSAAASATTAPLPTPAVPPAQHAPAGPFDGLSGATLLLAFYLTGLGMAATVCMYPLIPIVSTMIVGDGQHANKRRGLVLSLAYVQGIGAVYAIVGAVAALSGSFLVAALQLPWVIGAMALLFVLLALSMFGWFTLQLPASIQSKVNDASNNLSGGRLVPVFLMGALSSLIVGACMGPPLAAALGIVGSRADLLLGVVGFYLMAMGVGTPLVIVGVAGGHVLPKAGPWMTQIKNVFGGVMLGVAIWIARPVLPDWLFMLAWAALAIGAGVALSALDTLPPAVKPARRVAKAVGVLLLLVGAAQCIGLLAGSRDPLQPLKTLTTAQSTHAESTLAFQPINSPAQLDAALVAANGRPVLLDFYADWCVSCREMERYTFSDNQVRAKLGQFVLLKADVTANTPEQQALLKRFKLFGPPGTILFGHGGQEVGQRLIGFEAAQDFLHRLGQIAVS
ncbi:MAG: protein-disulfide reductase DsbD [Burkholderiales bacterium]|nr:protein-disulfide reductase DsbD [Burkholderiales bacterium]